MSAKVLIKGGHSAKEVNDAVSRAWPDVHFLLLRERRGGDKEAFLAPDEKLGAGSTAVITLDGTMTGREASEALRKAFGVVVEFSVESGRSVLNVPLDKAR